MKRFFTLLTSFIMILSLFTSCADKVEDVKLIHVTDDVIVGTNKNFLELYSDSVKVLLRKVGNELWTVKVLVPLRSITSWSEYPLSEANTVDGNYFEPKMEELSLKLLDADGAQVGGYLVPEQSVVSSIIESQSEVIMDVEFKEAVTVGVDYDTAKEMFDKAVRISIINAELKEVERASKKDNEDVLVEMDNEEEKFDENYDTERFNNDITITERKEAEAAASAAAADANEDQPTQKEDPENLE